MTHTNKARRPNALLMVRSMHHSRNILRTFYSTYRDGLHGDYFPRLPTNGTEGDVIQAPTTIANVINDI